MECTEDIFNSTNKTSTLQENFQKFLKERKRQIREKNFKSRMVLENRDTPEYQAALREKFLRRAKDYIGIPYAKRYTEPGSPEYNSPLFLDCCALVRQVLDDLKEDFGFRIGRWNQAYQYDLLTPEISFEEMKPGDLIFYSGTYYDAKKRRQLHDMVHVEIFLGGETGEQSIGARWFKGAVRIFDSYKFVSTNYYDIKFHYCSINLWLKGVCQSQCHLHPWRDDRKYNWLTHNSIFAEQQEDQEPKSTPGIELSPATDADSQA